MLIRKSLNIAAAPVDSDLVQAYRVLLGRDPDPGAREDYRREGADAGHTQVDLVRAIVDTPEFRNRLGARQIDAAPIALDGYVVYARANDMGIGEIIAAGKEYEPNVVPAFVEHLRPGAWVLDIGANIGFFTMLAAHKVGSSGRVIAVEPLDKNLQLICRAVVHNGFSQVEILPFAAAEKPGIVSVQTHARTSNAEMHPELDAAQTGGFAVALPLEPWLKNLERLDVVKIDVEGFEPLALRGMEKAMRKHKPVMLTEFHPQALQRNAGVAPEDYLARLFEYTPLVQILGRDGKRQPCQRPEEILREWQESNAAVGLDGRMHLDLLCVPE